MADEEFYCRVSADRISSRQIDELIGMARGMLADNCLNLLEVQFIEKWLAANFHISDQPLIRDLYQRISEMLSDDALTNDEHDELLSTLNSLVNQDFEIGEPLKATSLPLCNPPPLIEFFEKRFTFTGTFQYGQRKLCEKAVRDRGAEAGSLTQATDYLVIGVYATESWKHSAMGNKIIRACEMRSSGIPIAIVSELHWVQFVRCETR